MADTTEEELGTGLFRTPAMPALDPDVDSDIGASGPPQGVRVGALASAAGKADQFLFQTPAMPQAPERSIWSDVGTSFTSSMMQTGAAALGGAEYMFGTGGRLTQWRESATRVADDLAKSVSPEMQRALQREFIPGGDGESAWSSFGNFVGSAAAQVVATSGSLTVAVPAILAGAIAGPYAIPAAAVVAAGTGGVIGAGTVWNDAAQAFSGLPEEAKRRNPTYARLIEEGVDPASAANEAVREAARGFVELSAVGSAGLNAATGGFLGRVGSRELGGVGRGLIHGIKTEGPTEAVEEALQQDLSQRVQGPLTGKEYSGRETAEAAARAFIGGGALGGGMGAVGGVFSRGQAEPPPEVQAQPDAGAVQPPSPISPPVQPEPTPASVQPPPPAPTPTTPGVDPGVAAAMAESAPAPQAQSAPAPTPTPVTAPTPTVAPTLQSLDPAVVAAMTETSALPAAPEPTPQPATPIIAPPEVVPTLPGVPPVDPSIGQVAPPIEQVAPAPAPAPAPVAPPAAQAPVPVTPAPVAPAAPTPAPKPSPKIVSARRGIEPELISRAKTSAERLFGPEAPEASDAEVRDLVGAILDDVGVDLADMAGVSVREAQDQMRQRAVERIAGALSGRAKPENAVEEDTTQDEEQTPIRVSGNDLDRALADEPAPLRRIQQQVERIPNSKLGTFYRRVEAAVAKSGKPAPEWATALQEIASTAKRGASKEVRAARTAAIADWRKRFAGLGAKREASIDARRKEIEKRFDETPPTRNESASDAVKRFKAMRKAVDDATGRKDVAGQRALIGDDKARADALVRFLDSASKLTPQSSPDEIQAYRAVEAILRTGDFTDAMELLRQARSEAQTLGSGASDAAEDTDSTATPESGTDDDAQIDNQDVSLAEISAAMEAGRELLASEARDARAKSTRRLTAADAERYQNAEIGTADDAEVQAQLLAGRARRKAEADAEAARILETLQSVKRNRENATKLTLSLTPRAMAAEPNMMPLSAYDLVNQKPMAILHAGDSSITRLMFPRANQRQIDRASAQMDDVVNAEVSPEVAGTPMDQELWTRLKAQVGATPVLVYPDAVWNLTFPNRPQYGLFFPATPESVASGGHPGYIALPEQMLRDPWTPFGGDTSLRETLMHELVHAATYASTSMAKAPLRLKLSRLSKAVESAVGQYRDESPALKYFLEGGVEEVLTVGLTSREVQGFLKSVPLPSAQRKAIGVIGPSQTAWQAFVSWVRELLRIPVTNYTALDAVMELSRDALQSVPEQQAALRKHLDETGYLPTVAEVDAQAFMGMPKTIQNLAQRIVPEHIDESRIADVRQYFKRIGLGWSTARQIELMAKGLFTRDKRLSLLDPNSNMTPEQQLVAAHNRRRQIAEDRLAEFMPALREVTALPSEQQRTLSDILIDATVSEAHPDVPITDKKNQHLKGTGARHIQGRARHAELSKRYNALTPAGKKAYHATVDALRKAHSTVVRSLNDEVVDLWWVKQVDANLQDSAANPLPIQKAGLKALQERAFTDKLTAADKTMLGDEFVEILGKVRNRNKMDGPYVPLQRFGDFVVQWEENAPEFVEFDTHAEAQKHIEGSEYASLRLRQKFYDANGQEIIEPDPTVLQNKMGTALTEAGPQITPSERKALERKARADALKETRDNAAKKTWEVQQQTKGLAFFERISEANAAARDMREAKKSKVRQVSLRENPTARRELMTDPDVEKLTASIERDVSLPEEYRTKVADSLRTTMLLTAANRTLNASLIKRRKVIGASHDIKRITANYGVAVSNFSAGVDTALPIMTAFKSMTDQEHEGRLAPDDDGSTISRGNYIRELEQRILQNPVDTAGRGSTIPILRKVQALSYIYYLASPSYSLIQMSQPWMLSMPVLAARHGTVQGPAALARAMRDIGMGGTMAGGLKDTAAALRTLATGKESQHRDLVSLVKARLAGKADGADVNAMLDYLLAEGLVDKDAGLELMRAELSEDTWVGRKLGQTESLARAFPAAIEVINRTGTAVAAYRLARKQGKTHEQATMDAREVVDMTQADYSSSNTARFMDPRRYPWIAPMMTFRKYAQALYSLIARQAYLAVKGKTKAERREAFKTLAFVFGTHAVMAGTLGLPTEPITLVLGAAALLFGGDEPWDWEKEVRQALASAFGPQVAEMIALGLPRGAGVDLHGRMGLNSLMFVNDLRDYEKESMLGYAGQLVLGAPGAMVANALNGLQGLASGDPRAQAQAMEAIAPKGIRDAFKAARLASEGVTTKKGERIDSGRDLGTSEIVLQALGFQPAAVSEVYERRNAVQGANRRLNNERTGLLRQWRLADPADRNEVWQRIIEWNNELPREAREARITRANAIASLREANRRAKTAHQQDYLPKNREFLRKEGEFANVR